MKEKLRRRHALIIALIGELGAGKTTFVKGFARGLHIAGRILSPTFTLLKVHPLEAKYYSFLYHVDCYRITARDVKRALGWEKLLKDRRSIVVVEWADRIKKLLPKRRIDVFFSCSNKTSRTLKMVFHE